MNFKCTIPLNGFKRMVDSGLRLYLDISGSDQQQVLNNILSLDGKVLDCELTVEGEMSELSNLREQAYFKLSELANIRGASVDELKTKALQKCFGKESLKELTRDELKEIILTTEKAIASK